MLPWIALGAALGLAAADAGLGSRASAFGASAGALLASACLRAHPRARTLLLVIAAACAGAVALHARLEPARSSRPSEPRELIADASVCARASRAAGLDLELERVVCADACAPPAPQRVLLRLAPGDRSPLADALPGQRWRLALRLRAASPERNPGGRDLERSLARAGIGAVARLVDPALAVRLPELDRARWRAPLERLRVSLAAPLIALGPGGALLLALALGDRSGLDPALADGFAELGLSHLVAVSGLNVGVAAAAAFAVARALLRRSAWLCARSDVRAPALALALATAACYALLAGFGVPVRRALFFLAVAAVGWLRPLARGQGLALAALLVLAVEPEALFDAGAQLSFAASGALLLAPRARVPRRGGAREWLRAALRELLDSSALAGLVTAPLAAWHFARLAPAALAANLVAVPWVTGALFPASLAAVAWAALPSGVRELRLLRAPIEAAAALAEASAELAQRGALGAPELPLQGNPSAASMLAALGFAALAWGWREPVARAALALCQVVWLALAPAAGIEPAPPRLALLDVGQGDAVLVQGRRASLLVDAGTALPGGVDLGRSAVLPALRALGVRRLAAAVASHADLDHRGGLAAVLRALPVDELWLPPGAEDQLAYADLLALAGARSVRVRERAAGDPIEALGDLEVEVLWPPRSGARGSENDRSLVLRVRAGETAILLPADLERAGERALLARGAPLAAQLLKLGHHGSRSSSSDAFLSAVGAELALASAPCRGRFGMPHAEVRAALERANASLAWTGRDGALIVALSPPIWLRAWRAQPEAGCDALQARGAAHSAR